MTEQEKANELIERFIEYTDSFGEGQEGELKAAKQCALICVDEILKISSKYYDFNYAIYRSGNKLYDSEKEYYQKVKEIIKAK